MRTGELDFVIRIEDSSTSDPPPRVVVLFIFLWIGEKTVKTLGKIDQTGAGDIVAVLDVRAAASESEHQTKTYDLECGSCCSTIHPSGEPGRYQDTAVWSTSITADRSVVIQSVLKIDLFQIASSPDFLDIDTGFPEFRQQCPDHYSRRHAIWKTDLEDATVCGQFGRNAGKALNDIIRKDQRALRSERKKFAAVSR